MDKRYQVIYQIFVRNYSKKGTLEKVRQDLKRIKDLGVDIIYLTPIHEIGFKKRKGKWGSPYAIKDYFSISSDLGTFEDFNNLVNEVHHLGMKIILDMVFNHTSPDNVLVKEHPEYYFYKNGKRGNRVGDWSDIVDLATDREDVQQYLINVLSFWRQKGVDGFRFDVASTIPLSFFLKAREALGNDVFLLGESVDKGFGRYLQSINATYVDDESLGQVMDCLYNYNYLNEMISYLHKEIPLDDVVDKIEDDGTQIVRVNCLENHDKERFASYFDDENKMWEWVEFIYRLNGHAFIYMGQEYGLTHRPDLFEKDPVIWDKNEECYQKYQKLNEWKHHQDDSKATIKRENNFIFIDGKGYKL